MAEASDRGLLGLLKLMLPERRQVLNSIIFVAIGAASIWSANHMPHEWLQWLAKGGGFLALYSGLAPIIMKPLCVTVDAIADLVLGLTQPLRDRMKLWWFKQWHCNGDQQQFDRIMRNVRD